MLVFFKGKIRPIGYVTPGGYKKTKDGWIKVKKKTTATDNKKPFVIKDYYGKGKHKYFESETARLDFSKRMQSGMTGGKGRKIKSTSRLKIGTAVSFSYKNKTYKGKIVDTHKKEASVVPHSFDVAVTDANGRVTVYKNVQRDVLSKLKETIKDKKDRKKEKMQEAARDVQKRIVDDTIKQQANNLLMAHWDIFSKIIGKYYKKRVNAGFNAEKFGFTADDLKQELFITLQQAAESFLTSTVKHPNHQFKNYVLSFLKSNLASKIAAAAGIGNHTSSNTKTQMYLWLFRDTLKEYREKTGRIPSDVELLDILEAKRKALPDTKGNRTLKQYEWTIEKVKNKKRQVAQTVSLEATIEAGGGSETILGVLDNEDLDRIAGHLKIDPWKETQKKIIQEGIKSAIKRKLPNKVDQEILIRLYGLFVDEGAPQEIRQYAQGQSPAEVARALNTIEAKRGNRKRWTSAMVEVRELDILRLLRNDTEFQRKLKDFVKSIITEDEEWPDVGLILYWIAVHDSVSAAMQDAKIDVSSFT